MDLDEIDIRPSQPTLFDLGESSSGAVELFPALWQLSEALISPELTVRRAAIEQIMELDTARLLPLVAYLVATRIIETDLEVRVEVISTLGNVLLPDKEGHPAPESVRYCLTNYLAEMRTRQIYAMLQVLPDNPDLEPSVARLLNACPYAGNQLADILASRRVSLEIRRYAARLIGLVGYLEAIPAMERQLVRLESRLNGQQSMSFAPQETIDDAELIPDIRRALSLLKSP